VIGGYMLSKGLVMP